MPEQVPPGERINTKILSTCRPKRGHIVPASCTACYAPAPNRREQLSDAFVWPLTSVCLWIVMLLLNQQAVGGRPPLYASAPCKLTISSYLFARWHLFRHVGYLRHQQQLDLWPFDLESGVRVTCDVGYLCANFSLPRRLSVLDLRPMYATDRQTSDKRIALINASALWGRRHNN